MSHADHVAVPAEQPPRRMRYKQPGSRQTLAEGLAEYYTQPGLIAPAEVDPAARELFVNHDVSHVVFGCDASLPDEVLIDAWTVFGCDIGLLSYASYLFVPEVRSTFAQPGLRASLCAIVRTAPDIVRVIRRARRMRKKWPWAGYAANAGRPLDEIRRELGLGVLG